MCRFFEHYPWCTRNWKTIDCSKEMRLASEATASRTGVCHERAGNWGAPYPLYLHCLHRRWWSSLKHCRQDIPDGQEVCTNVMCLNTAPCKKHLIFVYRDNSSNFKPPQCEDVFVVRCFSLIASMLGLWVKTGARFNSWICVLKSFMFSNSPM